MIDAIRAVVADDDARVRHDFRAILELEEDIEVVAVAADGAAAVDVCDRLEPDVVVMDIRMPVMNGIEATRCLRRQHAGRCRVLVVTTFDLDDYVLGAVRAGASGFLLKDQAPDHLAVALRTIAAGEGIVSPRATARLLQEFVPPTGAGGAIPGGLTARELDLVRLMARGLSNEELAAAAYISRATVKSHVSHILTKLPDQPDTDRGVGLRARTRGLPEPGQPGLTGRRSLPTGPADVDARPPASHAADSPCG